MFGGILRVAAAVVARVKKPAPTPEPEMLIDARTLKAALPNITNADIALYLRPLNDTLAEYEIDTPLRIAHFLAQVSHESSDFRAERENMNYSATRLLQVFPKYFKSATVASAYSRKPEKIANKVYANRLGNGDEASGDGWKFRGNGPMQLTGRANHEAYAESCGIDVVSNPDLICEDPTLYMDSAGWFWDGRQLNELADADDLIAVTQRINGGQNGISDRRARLREAKKALGA